MTVQPSASRPASKSVGAAVVGIVLTLLIFATVMISFVTAPVAVCVGAYLVYLMQNGRHKKSIGTAAPSATETAAGARQQGHTSTHGFGAGTH